MSRPSLEERKDARILSEVARRAIRRLDILEWVILGGAFGLAVASSAAIAWLIVGGKHPHFRAIWIVTSILLFVIGGTIAIIRVRTADRESAVGQRHREEDHG